MKKLIKLYAIVYLSTLAVGVIVILLAELGGAQATDSGACYTISDPDARGYCIARARHDRSACYTIQKADLRAQCQAEVQ